MFSVLASNYHLLFFLRWSINPCREGPADFWGHSWSHFMFNNSYDERLNLVLVTLSDKKIEKGKEPKKQTKITDFSV